MSVEQEILVTGIKVVDLLAPYAKGGKIGTCFWAGSRPGLLMGQRSSVWGVTKLSCAPQGCSVAPAWGRPS